MNGGQILERARSIVGPPPAPFRGEVENWEDRLQAAALALVERARGYRRDPAQAAQRELTAQRRVAAKECVLLPSVTGDDLSDD